jgi:hypothetical protein
VASKEYETEEENECVSPLWSQHFVAATSAPSFFEQKLAHFSNDQRFVYYEHVVVSVMQFDDSRVLHA